MLLNLNYKHKIQPHASPVRYLFAVHIAVFLL